MSTFQKPDQEQRDALAHALREWHKRLVDAEVTVDLLVALGPVNKDGERTGPALRVHGVPAVALCKVTKIEERVLGLSDARIVIDGDQWPEFSAARRLAILDHELTHIELVLEMRAKKGKAKRGQPEPETTVEATPIIDEAGRPRLKLRPHDHEFGWFDSVAKRHKDAAIEVEQATNFADEFGQIYFWPRARKGKSR